MMKIHFSFRTLRRGHIDAELLSAYLDAQATPHERRRVEAHLAECAACQRELAGLRQTVTLLQALPRIPTPRAFTLAQVQVGRNRPASQPARFGGLLRGLAAASAVALVAVVAAALLRRDDWQPPSELARVIAPATAVADAHLLGAAPAQFREAAPAAAPAPQGVAVENATAPTKAPVPAAKPADAATAQRAAPAAIAPTAPAPPTMPTEAPAIAVAPTGAPAAPAESAAVLAAAPGHTPSPAPTVTLARTAPSAASTAGAASAVGPTANVERASRAETDGGAPAAAAKDATAPGELVPDFVLAFAAGGRLWTIDRAGGARQIAQADGLAAPAVSPDRGWIAYRQPGRDGAELWVVPWPAGEPRLLLAERDLQARGLVGYGERRFQDVRWLSDGRVLAVTASASALAPAAAPRTELWTVEVVSETRRLVTSSDIPYPPVAAPDGVSFALLRRAPDKPAEGDVWLIAADGKSERAVLRVPLHPDGRSEDVQISWLPDSRGFWLTVPDARPTGLLLYRVMLEGEVGPTIRLDARRAFWSPDGSRLVYLRPADGAAGAQELFVAAADGTAARRYATLLRGRFIAWSPDSARFLYEDGGQLFVGAAQEAALRLATNASAARWAGGDRVVYVAQQGASRQLIYQAVGGAPIVLHTLPANMPLDGLWP